MQNQNAILLQRFYLLPLMERVGQWREPLCCLLTQNQVAEVLGRTPLYPIPFCPDYLKGCIQRNGALAPVIDPNVLCFADTRQEQTSIHQLLIVRTGLTDEANGGFLNLALASAGTVLTFALTEQELARDVVVDAPPTDFSARDLARGFFRLRGRRVVLLDFDPLTSGSFKLERRGERKRDGAEKNILALDGVD